MDPVSKVSLTGVISVGGQTRALVGYGQSSGEICIGPDGRCPDQTATLLPAGWSSRAELGCLAQAPGLGRKMLRSGALRPLDRGARL